MERTSRSAITILDGPMGTELARLGVPIPEPLWSAWAVRHRPEIVAELHRAYVDAGADVLTATTFRTSHHAAGDDWEELTRRAVTLARDAAGSRPVAGSIAPVEDCYRPELSPLDATWQHARMARALADGGCDLLLCETFPHLGEALQAVAAAKRTGLPVWLGLTPGPTGALLTPEELRAGAERAIDLGVDAILVNCAPASKTLAYVEAITDLDVQIGAYANAGDAREGLGWTENPDAPRRYAQLADSWIGARATIVGSCCGTTPAHTRALVKLVNDALNA